MGKDGRRSHQGEEIEEQVSIVTNDVERLATEIDKSLELTRWPVTTVDGIHHVRSHDEWNSIPAQSNECDYDASTAKRNLATRRCLPLNVSKHLSIAEEFSEINVEQVSRRFQHDVIVVAIAYSENVCRDGVTGTGMREVFYRLTEREREREPRRLQTNSNNRVKVSGS